MRFRLVPPPKAYQQRRTMQPRSAEPLCVPPCNSRHAAEALDDDNLTILDLENIILTGQIIERQRDAQTREIKCVVAGITLDGAAAETVVKIGFTGKLVVITAYFCCVQVRALRKRRVAAEARYAKLRQRRGAACHRVDSNVVVPELW